MKRVRRYGRRARRVRRRRLTGMPVLPPVFAPSVGVRSGKRRRGYVKPSMGIGKRRRVGVRIVNRERPTGVSITQWSTNRRKYNLAKRRSRTTQALRLVNSLTSPVRMYWNGVKDFNSNGYYWLQNRINGTDRFAPVYLFDLTVFDSNPVPVSPLVKLSFDASGRAYFIPQSHVGPLGTSLQTEVEFAASASEYAHRKARLKYVTIHMNCWGCKNKSTKFNIDVVRFTDDNLAPKHILVDDSAYSVTDEAQKRTEFFQSLCKPLMFNPSSFTGGVFQKKCKTIRSHSFMLDPNTSIEADSDPAVRQYKLHLNLDRLINYTETASAFANPNTIPDTASLLFNTTPTVTRCQTTESARLYLMIRATNFGNDGDADVNTVTPSFDLRVRQGFSVVHALQ